MSKLVLASVKGFILIVSLPKNDPELAAAAAEGGAHALKLHVNVHHRASGTDFDTWEKEKENISKIMKETALPVGIMPGAEKVASGEEMKEMASLGVDFFDIYAHDMPVYLWETEDMAKIIALGENHTPELVEGIKTLAPDFVEGSIMSHEEYGKPLTIKDLALFSNLVRTLEIPLIIPTQKKIDPDDLKHLANVGAAGIMIGAVVTGHSADGIRETTRAFRKAVDSITQEQMDAIHFSDAEGEFTQW